MYYHIQEINFPIHECKIRFHIVAASLYLADGSAATLQSHLPNIKMSQKLTPFLNNYDISGIGLLVRGRSNSQEKKDIECTYDHRIVMMNYLILKFYNGGSIKPVKAIDKSFPEFLDIF